MLFLCLTCSCFCQYTNVQLPPFCLDKLINCTIMKYFSIIIIAIISVYNVSAQKPLFKTYYHSTKPSISTGIPIRPYSILQSGNNFIIPAYYYTKGINNVYCVSLRPNGDTNWTNIYNFPISPVGYFSFPTLAYRIDDTVTFVNINEYGFGTSMLVLKKITVHGDTLYSDVVRNRDNQLSASFLQAAAVLPNESYILGFSATFLPLTNNDSRYGVPGVFFANKMRQFQDTVLYDDIIPKGNKELREYTTVEGILPLKDKGFLVYGNRTYYVSQTSKAVYYGVYFLRIDSVGRKIWYKPRSLSRSESIYSNSVIELDNGTIVCALASAYTVVNGSQQIRCVVYDAEGNQQSDHSFYDAGASEFYVHGIVPMRDGGYIVYGGRNSIGERNRDSCAAYILKCSPDFEKQWSYHWESSTKNQFGDRIRCALALENGNIFLAGHYGGNMFAGEMDVSVTSVDDENNTLLSSTLYAKQRKVFTKRTPSDSEYISFYSMLGEHLYTVSIMSEIILPDNIFRSHAPYLYRVYDKKNTIHAQGTLFVE